MMRKLEDMSYKDALTNIGNRFAMSACVESIDEKQSIGVVYCDVTGLKYVNDTMGHEAGDRLILNAESDKREFKPNSVKTPLCVPFEQAEPLDT